DISKDLHLSVFYNPIKNSADSSRIEAVKKEEQKWMESILTQNNYGITEVAVLDGNIGYIEMPIFGPLDRCADTIVSAMKKIEDTRALIIDLRNCRGSLDENTIPFLCSFFFKEPVHLFDFHKRSNFIKQFWTYAWLPYQKYIDKPIYILTSSR